MNRSQLLVGILAAGCVHPPAHAQAPSERSVKAAFLVKFGAYVDWPPGAGPFAICLVGPDPFGPVLDRVAAAQMVGGRQIAVRRLPAVEATSGCGIAYLGGSAQQGVPAALGTLRSASVLTVTDGQRSPVRGMVHFQVVQNRVRFHIDEQAAARNGLAISSKLLALALSVKERSR